MIYGGVSMIVNVVGAFSLFHFFGATGVAAATTLAAWVNTGLLVSTLARRGHFRPDAALRKRLPLLAIAAILMGVGVALAAWWLGPLVTDARLIIRILVIGLLVALGMGLFALFCLLTGAIDFRQTIGRLRGRR